MLGIDNKHCFVAHLAEELGMVLHVAALQCGNVPFVIWIPLRWLPLELVPHELKYLSISFKMSVRKDSVLMNLFSLQAAVATHPIVI